MFKHIYKLLELLTKQMKMQDDAIDELRVKQEEHTKWINNMKSREDIRVTTFETKETSKH